MPIFDGNLPYTNLHELNNDWIVKTVKEVKEKADAIDETAEEIRQYSEDAHQSEIDAKGYRDEALELKNDTQSIYNDTVNHTSQFQSQIEDLQEGVSTNADNIDIQTLRIDNIISETTPDANVELIDIRTSFDGITYNTAGDAVRDSDQKLSDAINDISVMKLTLIPTTIITGYYIANDGTITVASGSPSQWEITDYVDVSGLRQVAITAKSYTNRLYYAFYDATQTYIPNSGRPYQSGVALTDEIVNVPVNAKYCVAMLYYDTLLEDPEIKSVDYVPDMTGAVVYDTDIVISDTERETARKNITSVGYVTGKNLLDLSKMESGYINSRAGTITTSTTYSTSDFIPIRAGQDIVFNTQIRKFLAYDITKTSISATFETSTQPAGYVFSATADGYVRRSFYNTDLPTAMVEYGTVPTQYESFRNVVEDSMYLSSSMVKQVESISGNFLYNKKWYACGDSFTSGDFTGLTDGYTFTDQPYMGQNKVYPFYIARRNGMIVNNVAVGGMTICPTNRPGNYFSPAIYTNIPADVDYITLAFGINDVGVGNPIGTINDSTDATFYGAWNVVMDYLIANYPVAKIGIIITNGISSLAYHDAIVNIAKKWGVPYLDILCDEQLPLMNRCLRADVLPSVQTIRNNNFRVSANNLHPNVIAHEYESSFIEQWLKNL